METVVSIGKWGQNLPITYLQHEYVIAELLGHD